MSRLPKVNGDDGNWGAILNDYLSQSHAADGTLNTNVIGAPQLKQNAVTSAAIAPGAVTTAALGTNAVTASAIADGTLPSAKLSDLGKAGGAAVLDGSGNITTAAGDIAITGQTVDAAAAAVVANGTSATAAALNAAYVPQTNSISRYGATPLASVLNPSTMLAPSGVKLAITTYVGGNNEVVEPSVYFNPNGLFGYEYWMAAGPYENSNDAYENPSIWCSHDGITWIVPPGGSNPVVQPPSSGNYDDPHLFEKGGTLYLSWNFTRSNNSDQVLLKSTTDGITWTATQAIRTGTDLTHHEYTSPHIEYQNGLWYMWTLYNNTTRSVTLSTAPSITGPWSAPTTCTMPLPVGFDHWEYEVRRVGAEWWMLQTLVHTGTTASGGCLYLRTSQDGITWNIGAAPLLVANSSNGGTRFDGNFIYKASFVPLLNGDIAIWYSAGQGAGIVWSIGYTVATKRANPNPVGSGLWYAPPCTVTTVTLQQGVVYYLPVYFDRVTALSGLGLEVTTAGSAGSVVSLGLYADNGTGQPGVLILDAGQIDGTSATVQTKAITAHVGPGIVWLAACGLGSPATQPTVRASSSPVIPIGTTAALASGNPLSGFKQVSQTALPVLAGAVSAANNISRLIYQAQ